MAQRSNDFFIDRMPTQLEVSNAEQLRTIMASLVSDQQPARLQVALEKGQTAEITLMPAIANTFLQVLRLISSGKSFKLMPVDAELTTQQAADHLNVSRPFLVKLLESGQIAFTKTGRHRRVRADDLFAFKVRRDQQRANALSDMAQLDADNGYI